RPPCSSNASRRICLWTPSASPYRSAPSRFSSAVEPSMSVKRKVTVPTGSSSIELTRELSHRNTSRATDARALLGVVYLTARDEAGDDRRNDLRGDREIDADIATGVALDLSVDADQPRPRVQ